MSRVLCCANRGGSEGQGYVHLSRCQGHQATVTHLDWSLPLYTPNGRGEGGGGWKERKEYTNERRGF